MHVAEFASTIAVDHDHETEQVRALLRAAADYLEVHRARR